MRELEKLARRAGFEQVAPLDVSGLELLPAVRDMCAADKCRQYGRSWVCPPACGTLEECGARLAGYSAGLLLQSIGELEDEFDIEGMQAAGLLQQSRLRVFSKAAKARYPELLVLGSGACTLCESCAYPGEACRHPKDALVSMEAFGLWVSDVCEKNALAYNYGKGKIAYTGCCFIR